MNSTSNSTLNFTPLQCNLTIGFSTLSALASLPFCIAYVVLHKEMGPKVSNQFLFRIFLSNFLTSIGSMVGLPSDYNFACWWEGLLTNIFTLTGIMWSIVLTLLLYSILAWKRPLQNHWSLELTCWGVPLVATLLPLMNSTYGPPGGQGWCWVVNNVDGSTPDWAPQVWFWVSYYLWVWLSFLMIILITIMSLVNFRDANALTKRNFFKAVISLSGYPLMILIAWGPVTFTDYIQYYLPWIPADNNERFMTNCLSTCMGFLQALVFWFFDEKVGKMLVMYIKSGCQRKKFDEAKRRMSLLISKSEGSSGKRASGQSSFASSTDGEMSTVDMANLGKGGAQGSPRPARNV